MSKTRVRAVEVAARAGVSRSTVSYILGGTSRHSFPEETINRVRQAAADLGYTPDAAARALRRGESGVILLAMREMPSSANLTELIAGLTDTVRATGRSLVSWAMRPGNRLADTLKDIVPAAILEIVPLTAEDEAAAEACRVPLISISDSSRRLDRAAGALQAEYLVGLGHRQLGIVSPNREDVEIFAEPRRLGVMEAAERLGLPQPLTVSVPPIDAAADDLAATLRAWSKRDTPVTGLCCYNDQFCGLALDAAETAGLRVPEDFSLIGIDDEPLGRLLHPRLTTIRYDFSPLVAHVRARLLEVLDGQSAQITSAQLPDSVELIERESARSVL
jgi:DNA-binding LacI/PurR family transcriptional regulator